MNNDQCRCMGEWLKETCNRRDSCARYVDRQNGRSYCMHMCGTCGEEYADFFIADKQNQSNDKK